MKKAILILAMLLISFVTIGQTQTQRKTLYESKKGFKFIETIQEGKSTKYFYYGFKNQKYQHISDYASIFLISKDKVETFANKLLEFSELDKGIELTYTDADFTIHQYDSFSSIFIFDKGKKYFTASKTEAKKIAEEILENINLLD